MATRPHPDRARRRSRAAADPVGRRGGAVGRKAPLPDVPQAELATLVEAAPAGDDWLHEVKFDGYRILARVAGGRATLVSRNGRDWTGSFPSVARAAAALRVKNAVLDGEVVRVDAEGRTSFQGLQEALGGEHEGEVAYFVFDLPYRDGRDLSEVPLEERKRVLKRLVPKRGPIRFSDHVKGRGPEFHRVACGQGLEGIVSKLASSRYRPYRTRDWLKVRCGERQEMVLVGWTPHSADSRAIGALLLGVHDDRGRLRFAGKVGTGFDDATRRALRARLERIPSETPTAVDAPRDRDFRWARPRWVAEVKFTEWTSDGRLRHPVFLGLREDKSPAEVVRERRPKPGTRKR